MKYLILLLIPFSVYAGDFTFEPPIQRADNTALTEAEIKGYRVFVNGIQKKIIPNTPYKFWVKTVTGDAVTMKTMDTEGRESDLSVPYIIKAIPNPPVLQ